MKTDIILIRHGETEANASGIWQGHMDGKLSTTGKEQAKAIGERLRSFTIDAIISSDLSRAVDTANAIAQHHPHDVMTDPRLRERHLGLFQGLTPDQSAEKHPEEWERHKTGDPDNVIPTGESASDHRKRALASFTDLANAHGGSTIVVVTHGGTLSGLLRYITGIPMDAPRAWSNPNCGFNRVVYNHPEAKWTVKTWADVSHLP